MCDQQVLPFPHMSYFSLIANIAFLRQTRPGTMMPLMLRLVMQRDLSDVSRAVRRIDLGFVPRDSVLRLL